MAIADLSSCDSPIDWSIARKNLELIIFRASIGNNQDKKYLQYSSECNVPYGAYHYVKAGTAEDAREEARFFVECANAAKQKPLFYIGDIEYEAQNSKTTEPVCVAFLDELRKLGCKKIGLYINRRYKYAGKAIDMCDIMWIPHWGKNDGNIPGESSKPKYYNDLWQYTSEGWVEGIGETIDLNLLNGDKPLEYFTEGWIPFKGILGEAVLKKGFKGDDIKELQQKLNTILKLKLTIDGIFGEKTENAIKQFQEKYLLNVNGMYDEETHKAFIKLFNPAEFKGFLTKNSVNVRVGDSTDYNIITNLPKDTILDVVLNKENKPVISSKGWYAIRIMNKIGWLSGNYVKENT